MLDYFTEHHAGDTANEEGFALNEECYDEDEDVVLADKDCDDDDDMSLDLADALWDYQDLLFEDFLDDKLHGTSNEGNGAATKEDDSDDEDEEDDTSDCHIKKLDGSQFTVETATTSSSCFMDYFIGTTINAFEESQERLTRCMQRTEYTRSLIKNLPPTTETSTKPTSQVDNVLSQIYCGATLLKKKDSPLQKFLRSGGGSKSGGRNANRNHDGNMTLSRRRSQRAFQTISLTSFNDAKESSFENALERLGKCMKRTTETRNLVLLKHVSSSESLVMRHRRRDNESHHTRSHSFNRRIESCPGFR